HDVAIDPTEEHRLARQPHGRQPKAEAAVGVQAAEHDRLAAAQVRADPQPGRGGDEEPLVEVIRPQRRAGPGPRLVVGAGEADPRTPVASDGTEADRSGPRPGLGHQRARILDVGQRRVGGLLDAAIEADAERVAGLEAALARVDAAATEGPLPTKRHVLERDRRRGSQGPERADPDSIADHPRASLARPDADLDVHLPDRPAAAGPGEN